MLNCLLINFIVLLYFSSFDVFLNVPNVFTFSYSCKSRWRMIRLSMKVSVCRFKMSFGMKNIIFFIDINVISVSDIDLVNLKWTEFRWSIKSFTSCNEWSQIKNISSMKR